MTARAPSSGVSIELTASQVAAVVNSLSGTLAAQSVFVAARGAAGSRIAELHSLDDPRLSSSFLIGLLVLLAFPDDGTWAGNSEIARHIEMSPSTTHRYISTLLATGLLERHPQTRKYRRAQ